MPVLYQEDHDPQLFRHLPIRSARRLIESARRGSSGAVPDPPAHQFVGRSRERLKLKLERLLARERFAVVCGAAQAVRGDPEPDQPTAAGVCLGVKLVVADNPFYTSSPGVRGAPW